MNTMRILCALVVFFSVNGCMKSVPPLNNDVASEKEMRSVEMLTPMDEKVEENGTLSAEAAKTSGEKVAGIEKPVPPKKITLPKGSPDKAGSNQKVSPTGGTPRLVPPKSVKVGSDLAVKGKGLNQKESAVVKDVREATAAQEKKIEQRASVQMSVTAEKAVSSKSTVIESKSSTTSTVIVRKVTIPFRDGKKTSQFMPKVMTVKIGEKVLWVNKDARTHFINKKPEISAFSIMVDVEGDDEEEEEGQAAEEQGFNNSPFIQYGQSWGQVFKKKGRYNYYCFTHPLEMRGTIVVE